MERGERFSEEGGESLFYRGTYSSTTYMGSSTPRAAHSLWKEKPMLEVLLDPEVLGNTALATLLILTMFVVRRWVDKHRPHH